MWAYDDGRGRRARDIPSSQPAYYYDDAYEPPDPRSTRAAYDDPPRQSSQHDRHRRHKSVFAGQDEPRHSRRAGGVHVVASDDGSPYPYGRAGLGGGAPSRDAAGSGAPYPETRSSRHDAERKTGQRNEEFRKKRNEWDDEEMRSFRRAKSYSPKRAAAAAHSAWPLDDEYGYRSSAGGGGKKGSSHKSRSYGNGDPWAAGAYGQAPPGEESRGRGGYNSNYDYAPSPSGMPRPPLGGDRIPFKSSPLAATAEEATRPSRKPGSKHSRREQEKPSHFTGAYDGYPGYNDRGAYEEPQFRRGRYRGDDDPYAATTQPPRGRHRPTPGDDSPYSAQANPRQRDRDRRSLPPHNSRSRYEDYDAEPVPPRRSASTSYGAGYGAAYGDPRDNPRGRAERSASGGSGSASKKPKGEKGRKWQKQAGQLFMAHAVPMIKKEAVPFLTKAAQAYFDQQRK